MNHRKIVSDLLKQSLSYDLNFDRFEDVVAGSLSGEWVKVKRKDRDGCYSKTDRYIDCNLHRIIAIAKRRSAKTSREAAVLAWIIKEAEFQIEDDKETEAMDLRLTRIK